MRGALHEPVRTSLCTYNLACPGRGTPALSRVQSEFRFAAPRSLYFEFMSLRLFQKVLENQSLSLSLSLLLSLCHSLSLFLSRALSNFGQSHRFSQNCCWMSRSSSLGTCCAHAAPTSGSVPVPREGILRPRHPTTYFAATYMYVYIYIHMCADMQLHITSDTWVNISKKRTYL